MEAVSNINTGLFYSHVNYSVTKIASMSCSVQSEFYSHVNYSVTKMEKLNVSRCSRFTVT